MPVSELPAIRRRGQASKIVKKCSYCIAEINVKGLASHERACLRKKEDLEKTAAFLRGHRDIGQDEDLAAALKETNHELAEMINGGNGAESDNDQNNDLLNDRQESAHTAAVLPTSIGAIEPPIDPKTGKIIDDAIKIVYHPNSGRAEEIRSLHDYRQDMKATQPVEQQPWSPFKTRGDYEYAELSLAASLSAQQNNALISLIHRFVRGELDFTISSHADLQNKWTQASSKLTDFQEKVFEVSFQREKREFKVFYRPMWDWMLDLLTDARIVSQFVWDARRLYKYQSSTKSYVRFFDEPWTADRFWEVQSEFSDKATKPLSIIFYADKNKLSSFGTQKGYPVVARCANLPIEIRNSDGIGGGVIVGWLPIVPENSEDSGKTAFANFKTAVWHRAVAIILKSIKNKSKFSCSVQCGDGIVRHVCPHILMISSDHEEQFVIALNRGLKGKKACTVCNHPTEKLSNLLVDYSFRVAEDSKGYYEISKSLKTLKWKNFFLKVHGLRPVKNAFWEIGHTDVHRAISWDRLHSYHSGLFAGHIWKVLKLYFERLGRSTEEKVDSRLSLFPRWRNLYHFDKATTITFNDGSKHEDLSKAYTALTKDKSPKNWNFMKAHSHKHACEDIRAKGVTRNYNTKPNEKMHGPLRNIYHRQTNFRDVSPQILRVSHHNLVSTFIRSQLDAIDKEQDLDKDVTECWQYI